MSKILQQPLLKNTHISPISAPYGCNIAQLCVNHSPIKCDRFCIIAGILPRFIVLVVRFCALMSKKTVDPNKDRRRSLLVLFVRNGLVERASSFNHLISRMVESVVGKIGGDFGVRGELDANIVQHHANRHLRGHCSRPCPYTDLVVQWFDGSCARRLQ